MDDTNAGVGRVKRGGALLRGLNGLDRVIGVVEAFIIGGSILVMAAIMSAHVVGRALLDQGIAGTYELTELLLILITFVGVSYGERNARHISMSALYDQLSGRARKAMLVFICVVTGAFMFYLAWVGAEYTYDIWNRGRTTSALRIPLWIVYLAVPIGLTLAGIQYWMTAVRNLTTAGIYRSFNEQEEYADVPVEGEASTTGNTVDSDSGRA